MLYSNTYTAPHIYRPIIMRNPGGVNATVLFTRPPSLSVTEGDELQDQPAIKLFGSSTGKPISGVGCIAVINGKNEDIYPKRYVFSEFCNFSL